MKRFKADLHIHTVLSPCGSLEMSPKIIVEHALSAGLDIIGITDHNSTRQSQIIRDYACEKGLHVICGAEVNTAEEVHCLALFEKDEELNEFQSFLDIKLKNIKNNPDIFGYQVYVDVNEKILGMEERLLISSLDADIYEVEEKVHILNGLFIPAHIFRPYNGIINQLGFIPSNLKADAFEVSSINDISSLNQTLRIPYKGTFIKNSDAHTPRMIGKSFTTFEMESLSFAEIRMAFADENGRKVILE
ncbi:MAG: PHP domain-containing protein [Prolixibacteraceae bacterium]|nr:PHP domain-containing protein [Prolixibacteraceae bacterium]